MPVCRRHANSEFTKSQCQVDCQRSKVKLKGRKINTHRRLKKTQNQPNKQTKTTTTSKQKQLFTRKQAVTTAETIFGQRHRIYFRFLKIAQLRKGFPMIVGRRHFCKVNLFPVLEKQRCDQHYANVNPGNFYAVYTNIF